MDELHGLFWSGDIENYWIGHQAEEIFKTRLYAPYLEGKKDAFVIDLGANLGLFSLYAQKYAKQVWALEPDPENFFAFSHMVAFNHFSNIKPIQKAIYIEEGTFDFHQNMNKTMKSLNAAVTDGSSRPVPVQAITIDQLFKDEKIDHVDLLKLDIEGTEVELVASLGFSEVAPKIDVVIGEYHQWSGRNPNQLKEALENNGFKFEWYPHDASLFRAYR